MGQLNARRHLRGSFKIPMDQLLDQRWPEDSRRISARMSLLEAARFCECWFCEAIYRLTGSIPVHRRAGAEGHEGNHNM
jgi:hypothetical protein